MVERVANMVLKPSKCFLVVSALDLTEDAVRAIKEWLATNIPEWRDFQIVSASKYLGITLGRSGAEETYRGPVEKYTERVKELAENQAPSLPTILRYNERVATVFSYVAQVVSPPAGVDLASIEQHSIHKILKLPPNCMSRKLALSIEPFSLVVPRCLSALCDAAMFRFASSEGPS